MDPVTMMAASAVLPMAAPVIQPVLGTVGQALDGLVKDCLGDEDEE